MTKILAVGCVAALAVLFLYACNDKLDVQQEYDFSLSCWHSTFRAPFAKMRAWRCALR